MKINELKMVGEEPYEKVIVIPAEFDDAGNLIAEEHEETIIVYKPQMIPVVRDMTPEEEAAFIAEQEEFERIEATREPTFEERIEAQVIYTALMTDTLIEEE